MTPNPHYSPPLGVRGFIVTGALGSAQWVTRQATYFLNGIFCD